MASCSGRMRIHRFVVVALVLATSPASAQDPPPPYPWPVGKRAAVSLSFDDGRASQMDAGLPVLNSLGVKVTFYVVPGAIEKRQTAWRAAAPKN